jgi:hypothetical protein
MRKLKESFSSLWVSSCWCCPPGQPIAYPANAAAGKCTGPGAREQPSACGRSVTARRANHLLKNRSAFDLSIPFRKNISIFPDPKSPPYNVLSCPDERGVGQRRKRGAGAMDVKVLLDVQHRRGRPSRVVLAPRRWCQVCETKALQAMVAKKPGTPGRSRSNRNTIARGMPA